MHIGHVTDESKTTRRMQPQTAEENTTAEIFQANYQYTPLKEYAAMKSTQSSNDYRSKFPLSFDQDRSEGNKMIAMKFYNLCSLKIYKAFHSSNSS